MRILIAAILMLSAAQAAEAQSGSAPFCLKAGTGALNCVYGTMGDCERARPSMSADQCITRADADGTTGLGDRPRRPEGTPPGPYAPAARER
jgi:hypothetical protein